MIVQRVAIWQWVLIGLLVGAGLGFVWTSGRDDQVPPDTWGLRRFINTLDLRTDSGDSILTNIVIDPLMTDGAGKQVQRVYFERLAKHKKSGRWDPVEAGSVVAEVPLFKTSENKDFRISDYLKQKSEEIKTLKYSYAWWKVSGLSAEQLAKGDRELRPWQKPAVAWATAISSGVLVIGVLWPMLIRVLVKMGFGLPDDELAAVDLSKVKNRKSKPMERAKAVTKADMDSLSAMNAKLESNVADMLLKGDRNAEDEHERREEEKAIKKLNATRLEAEHAATAPEEPKEYTGEFYPVVKPHGHPEEHKK